MRKLFNNPWFVAALALGALAFVGQSFLPKRNIAGSVGVAPVNSAEIEVAETSQPIPESLAPQSGDELAALTLAPIKRDPFAPSAKSAATLAATEKARPDQVETVHLSALWSQDGVTYVLLNGSIHQSGDEIGRLKIETASADGVWLAHWKGRDHLELGDDFTLRTPASGPVTLVSSL